MTRGAELDASKLSILLDVRHPLAYLALHPSLAFAAARGLDVNWLPLSVPPLHPPSEPAPDDDRGVRHRRYRAQAIAREIDTYAAAQGLVVRDCYRNADADAVVLGWLWIRDRQTDALPRFLTEVFAAYWSVALDAASVDDVAAVVASVGADATAFRRFAAREGPTAAAALADELREHGLFQVPAFVVEDEVFYGRQHLPMIAWILDGRRGPGPI